MVLGSVPAVDEVNTVMLGSVSPAVVKAGLVVEVFSATTVVLGSAPAVDKANAVLALVSATTVAL